MAFAKQEFFKAKDQSLLMKCSFLLRIEFQFCSFSFLFNLNKGANQSEASDLL